MFNRNFAWLLYKVRHTIGRLFLDILCSYTENTPARLHCLALLVRFSNRQPPRLIEHWIITTFFYIVKCKHFNCSFSFDRIQAIFRLPSNKPSLVFVHLVYGSELLWLLSAKWYCTYEHRYMYVTPRRKKLILSSAMLMSQLSRLRNSKLENTKWPP